MNSATASGPFSTSRASEAATHSECIVLRVKMLCSFDLHATGVPHRKMTGFGCRVEEGMDRQVAQGPALVACPDNFAVRALLNKWAKRHRRTLISGGTSAAGGSCLVYEPEQTAVVSLGGEEADEMAAELCEEAEIKMLVRSSGEQREMHYADTGRVV